MHSDSLPAEHPHLAWALCPSTPTPSARMVVAKFWLWSSQNSTVVWPEFDHGSVKTARQSTRTPPNTPPEHPHALGMHGCDWNPTALRLNFDRSWSSIGSWLDSDRIAAGLRSKSIPIATVMLRYVTAAIWLNFDSNRIAAWFRSDCESDSGDAEQQRVLGHAEAVLGRAEELLCIPKHDWTSECGRNGWLICSRARARTAWCPAYQTHIYI